MYAFHPKGYMSPDDLLTNALAPVHAKLLEAGFAYTHEGTLRVYTGNGYKAVVESIAYSIFLRVKVECPAGSFNQTRVTFSKVGEEIIHHLADRGFDLTQQLRLRRLRALLAEE